MTDVRDTPLFKKILGAMVGGAIGDAFGYRTENMHYRDIEAQYGRVTHFDELPPRAPSREPLLERFNPVGRPPAPPTTVPRAYGALGRWGDDVGVYTDDMRYRLITYHAIVRTGRPVGSADLAEAWWNYRLMAEGVADVPPTPSWPGPQREFARMLASLNALSEMARAQRPCIAGWDGPLGVMHAGDPARAATIGSSMAVAMATAMLPRATIDDVVANVQRYSYCLGNHSRDFALRMQRLLEVVSDCDDVFDLREPFYREFLVTYPPWDAVFSLEMVPCALALCVLARGDFETAVVGAANMGRDADTIGAITGELMGALVGVDAMPPEWVAKVLRLNPEPELAQMAEGVFRVVVDHAGRQRERASAILSLAEAPSRG